MKDNSGRCPNYLEEWDRHRQKIYELQSQVLNLETEVVFYSEKQRLANEKLKEIRIELENLLEGDC